MTKASKLTSSSVSKKKFLAAFIWDFDGVVVLTPHYEAWSIACRDYGIKGFTIDFYNKYVSGKPRLEGGRNILSLLASEWFNKLSLKERNKLLKEFTDYKNRVFKELIDKGVYRVNNDVVDFLISTYDDFLNILASASKNARYIAERAIVDNKLRVIDLFRVDVSGSGSTKIDVFRNALRKALEEYNISRECIFVIEDSIAGIEAAHKLSMKAIGYIRYTSSQELMEKADYIVKEFSSINPFDLIRGLGCKYES